MKNIDLINASAGSGKTYKLTSLIIEQLNSGIAPETLMATTFTKKAAAELRERIRYQLLKNNKSEESERINDGFIGTVNGICSQLLKEYAIDAGLSPAIDVIPDEDRDRIFKIAIESVINQAADSIEPAAKRMELDGSAKGTDNPPDWRKQVKEIVDLARNNQITTDQLRECSHRSWEAFEQILGDPLTVNPDLELRNQMKTAIECLESMPKLTSGSQKALVLLKDCEKHIAKGRMTWRDWIRLAKLETPKDGKEIVEPVSAEADQVLRHPQLHADIRQIIQGTFECAINALKSYDRYKSEHGLMDFSDQETKVLDLAMYNEAFRASMRERVQTLMVDEFQDTSPIQLSLFLALNELAGHSVWVGDPKQAIYGFRGTDPQLMNEVVALIDTPQVLDYSWRSRENLILFTNALFSEVFHEMGSEKVCLKVPAERAEKAKAGRLETWHLLTSNKEQDAIAVANGVRELIERIPDIRTGDIAVLCRKNDNCKAVAAELEKMGIRASVGQGLLMDTKEGRIAIAALRYMNNQADSLALAEIIQTTADKDNPENWFSDLMTDPAESIRKWQKNPLIAALDDGRDYVRNWTPIEALEQAIIRVRLLRLAKAWPNTSMVKNNLDALRGSCRKYIEQCASHRSAATIDGYISYVTDAEAEQAKGTGDNTVKIFTYHGAKGLEWPWVILTDLDSDPRFGVFGVQIEVAAKFDPADPLANRNIRYWPWPFGAQKTYVQLDEKIDALPISQSAKEKEEKESQRLLYVGMTRARDGLILAMRKNTPQSGIPSLKTGWLDSLVGPDKQSVITWSTVAGRQETRVGKSMIPVTAYEYESESSELSSLLSEEEEFLMSISNTQEYPPVRISPSNLSEAADSDNCTCEIIENMHARINIKGNPEMDLVGNAIHAYLAADVVSLSDQDRLGLAQKIIANWNLEKELEPIEIIAAGRRLTDYLKRKYPGHKAFKEWPMTLRNEKRQLFQGWIDLLLELPSGYVIIDHKSFPGQNAEERAKKYAPQLVAYKEAVEKATGKPVIDMLLHLPVNGLIVKVKQRGCILL